MNALTALPALPSLAALSDRPVASAQVVQVQAPARLHLGFLDPGASLGRRFGSLGLTINGLATVIEARHADRDSVSLAPGVPEAEGARALSFLLRTRQALPGSRPVALRLQHLLPEHQGFGSGTQMALAIAHAVACLEGHARSAAELARATGRGLRSGIGIASFEQGGLLLDGGPGRHAAPLLCRLAFPEDWPVLLIKEPASRGLSGEAERQAIASLPPLPREHAAAICHRALMQVLPAVSESDFAAFAQGVSAIQRLLGEHFAPAQEGRVWASPHVAPLLDALERQHGAAIGQSSWGPTGFAIFPSLARGQEAVAWAAQQGLISDAIALQWVSARNRGADVHWLPHSD